MLRNLYPSATFNSGRIPSNNSSPFRKVSQVFTPTQTQTSLHFGLLSPLDEINSSAMERYNQINNRMQIENSQGNYHSNFATLDLKIHKSETIQTQSQSMSIKLIY